MEIPSLQKIIQYSLVIVILATTVIQTSASGSEKIPLEIRKKTEQALADAHYHEYVDYVKTNNEMTHAFEGLILRKIPLLNLADYTNKYLRYFNLIGTPFEDVHVLHCHWALIEPHPGSIVIVLDDSAWIVTVDPSIRFEDTILQLDSALSTINKLIELPREFEFEPEEILRICVLLFEFLGRPAAIDPIQVLSSWRDLYGIHFKREAAFDTSTGVSERLSSVIVDPTFREIDGRYEILLYTRTADTFVRKHLFIFEKNRLREIEQEFIGAFGERSVKM